MLPDDDDDFDLGGDLFNCFFVQAASIFVGVAALLFLLSTVCFLLFFFLNTATVLKICGWFQIIGGKCTDLPFSGSTAGFRSSEVSTPIYRPHDLRLVSDHQR